MLKKVKSIKLFLNIEYYDIGQYSTMDNEGRFTPEPEGWYYTGKKYSFQTNLDLSTDFSIPLSKEAKEIDNPEAAKNRVYVLNQLRKYNNEQLKLLCLEFTYWNDKNNLSSSVNPKFQSITNFYETILYDFQYWYEITNSPIPEECSHPILKSPKETSEEDLTDASEGKSIDSEVSTLEKNNLKNCLEKSDIDEILIELENTLKEDEKWMGIKARGARTKFSRIVERIFKAEYMKDLSRVDFASSLFPHLDKKYKLKNKINWDEKKLANSMKKKVPKVKKVKL